MTIKESSLTEVFIVQPWNNPSGDEQPDSFIAICATKQLADQVLDYKGGHSFGSVSKMKIATTMQEARGF